MELRPPPSPNAPQKSPASGLLLGLNILAIAMLGGLVYLQLKGEASPSDSATVDTTRSVASKLKAAGALDESTRLYAEYIESNPTHANLDGVAYTLAEMYMELGQYQKALRWLYQAEVTATGKLKQEVASKIVHCLERLGRGFAAQAVLSQASALPGSTVQRAAGDPVVARIGSQDIFQSDLDRFLDDMPPELAKSMQGAGRSQQLLQKYVADELLWRKAQKLEMDQSDAVRRQMATLLKHVVVGKFIETEIVGKIKTDETDLKTFFEVNQAKYKQGEEQLTYEQAKSQVARDYRMMKIQDAYSAVVQQEMATGDVELFFDKLGAQKPE